MNSSGMKRGLAVAAVSALAFAGLALTPASAQTIAGSGEPLTLYSQYTSGATTQGTVTLLAGTRNPDGVNVNHMRFSFSPDGVTWTQIGGNFVPVDGVATTEWAAPAGTWDIRVQSFDNGSNVIDTDIQSGVVVAANAAGVDFSNALFAQVGQWDNEIVARGSAVGGSEAVLLSARGPETTVGGIFAQQFNLATGVFAGVVDLGINNTIDPTDQVVIGARGLDLDAPPDTDDVTVVTVYDQVVNNVTKSLAPGSVALVPTGSGANTTYNLKVTDQNGNNIQGVDVYESNGAGAATPTGNGTPNVGETDVDGVFQGTLNEAEIDDAEDQNGAANTQRTHYVVDVNQNGTYENGTDWLFALDQSRYAPVATTVEIDNELGHVMDDEEISDATILVKDQNGNPVPAGTTVRIKQDRAGADAGDDVGTYADFVTNAQGKVIYPINTDTNQTEVITIFAYVNKDGDPNPTPADAIATPYVIDADTTLVSWDEGNLAQVLVGSTTTFTGKLVQENTGKAMPNRPMDIDYTDGTTPLANSILAPQAAQPAGTTRGSDTEAAVITGNNGGFGVAVTDPVPPNGQELDANLAVSSDSLPNGLDTENDPVNLEVDFLRSLTPDRVRILNDVGGTEADGLTSLLSGSLIPGGLGLGEVTVENSDGVLLEEVDVDLTIEEGFFVDLNDPFEPTPAVGAPIDFASAGQAFTVTTDDNGEAIFLANIERHEGFDDDGEVDDNMTADAGPVSDVHDLTWTTNAVPLNPRATNPLVVELSADQESGILPKARAGDVEFDVDGTFSDGVGQVVTYDVSTYDQFGNPTSQPTTVTDNTPVADFNEFGSQFDLGQPAIEAWADQATDQELEVELDGAVEITYADNPFNSEFDPNNPFAFFNNDPVQVEENTDAINWYDVDYDASTFTLGQDGPEQVPVQSAVTEVLTATDQEGQPIENLFVDFLRGGPGNEDDDSCNEDLLNNCLRTDINGEAFYDFVGGSMGTATVTAVVYEPDAGTRIATVGPDTVQFTQGGQVAINAKLSGKNRNGKDVLKVNAPAKASGAVVKLQKKTKNGWKQVGPASTLNASGDHTFKVADKNGSKATTYRAKVSPTSDTKGDTTNKVTLK